MDASDVFVGFHLLQVYKDSIVQVLYAGQPVPGDPFTFYVHAPVPGQVTAFGPGLVSGAVNQPCVFTVVTKNAGKGLLLADTANISKLI